MPRSSRRRRRRRARRAGPRSSTRRHSRAISSGYCSRPRDGRPHDGQPRSLCRRIAGAHPHARAGHDLWDRPLARPGTRGGAVLGDRRDHRHPRAHGARRRRRGRDPARQRGPVRRVEDRRRRLSRLPRRAHALHARSGNRRIERRPEDLARLAGAAGRALERHQSQDHPFLLRIPAAIRRSGERASHARPHCAGRSLRDPGPAGEVRRRVDRGAPVGSHAGEARRVHLDEPRLRRVAGGPGRAPRARMSADPAIRDAAHLFGAGRYDEALAACRAIIATDPRHFYALHLASATALKLSRFDDCIALATRALAVSPSHAEVLANRGAALRRTNRVEEALADYDLALASGAATPTLLVNRGIALAALNRHAEAIAQYERALALDPRHAPAHFHRGLSRLATGDLAGGFADNEWRWAGSETQGPARELPGRRWTGVEDLKGATILLYAEQGLGDAIQMARYASVAKQRGARGVLEGHPPLKR